MHHPSHTSGRSLLTRRRKHSPQLELLEVRRLLSTTLVTNTSDSGDGSLRAAITLANVGTSGIDTIDFAIPGPGVHTIAPLTQLPTITNPVTIDGYSQPGSATNTNGPGLGDNAVLQIELSGANAAIPIGLQITAGNSSVRGLVIDQFQIQAILLETKGGNLVAGDFIGTNAAGTTALANGFQNSTKGAITIYQSTANTVGGTTAGDRNIISGNNGQGLDIEGNADDNLVQGNFIGTDATGTVPMPNASAETQFNGVLIGNGGGNTIGGTVAEARNVISGNDRGMALFMTTTGYATNLVEGNFIGTDVTGTAPLANQAEGIYIVSDTSLALSSIAMVGGSGAGAGNTIAFNGSAGVSVTSGVGNDVSGNAILGNSIFSNGNLGIDLNGDGVTPNTADGPHVGPNNLQNFPVLTSVTTTTTGTTIIGTLNSTPYTPFTIQFFSNSTADPSGYGEGKTYLGELTNQFTQGNMAFFTATLNLGIGPGQYVTATATDPGGNTSEFSQDVLATYINPLLVTNTADSGPGSLRAAITYANANPGADTITFDIPGTGVQTIAPQSPLPAITASVTIDGYSQPGAHANTLALGDNASILIEINGGLTGGGGFSPSTGDGLALSGGNSTIRGLAIDGFSSGAAIHVLSPGGDTIAGDFLGIDPSGTVAKPDKVGVQVETANNTIGGTTPADRDVVSANTFIEVYLLGEGATSNTVEGDFVGTNAAGTASLSNVGGGDGVDIDDGASANTIGGTTAGARNILSGNGVSGVRIAVAGTNNNVVYGNYIGTDVTGTKRLGNAFHGVLIHRGASGNLIGGPAAGMGNLISANLIEGVTFSDANTAGNSIEGNLIGTDASGTADLGNGADGVALSNGAFNNSVGGTTPGAGNTIGFNVLNGVDILGGAGNPILSNVIFGNHLLGIDLGGDGVTPNTPGGPSLRFQRPPELPGAQLGGHHRQRPPS